MKIPVAIMVLALLVAGSVRPCLAAVPKTLVYTGSMADEKGAPVGGIYWFRFALHRSKSDQKMVWSEEMYAALDMGNYQVELGKERPIPQALDLTTLFLSVQVDGLEIHRLQVDNTMISGGSGRAATAGNKSAASDSGSCQDCEKAKRAEDCDRLGGMSVKQLANTVAAKQLKVGTTAHFTSAVGSGEGSPFRLTCPPGFIVTGIKGKADEKISNLQLVCSPLEAK
jgi:hypothetical protein